MNTLKLSLLPAFPHFCTGGGVIHLCVTEAVWMCWWPSRARMGLPHWRSGLFEVRAGQFHVRLALLGDPHAFDRLAVEVHGRVLTCLRGSNAGRDLLRYLHKDRVVLQL
ncbi:hypothetical protein [Deinococcus hopiensis]|uniref:hypothetical protein n=1 Tax=Deinococcus hopiensis TaxID=309885 RepID=UPI00111C0DF3|nr:hypothetical protein [Deinococcus hopiensis]